MCLRLESEELVWPTSHGRPLIWFRGRPASQSRHVPTVDFGVFGSSSICYKRTIASESQFCR